MSKSVYAYVGFHDWRIGSGALFIVPLRDLLATIIGMVVLAHGNRRHAGVGSIPTPKQLTRPHPGRRRGRNDGNAVLDTSD